MLEPEGYPPHVLISHKVSREITKQTSSIYPSLEGGEKFDMVCVCGEGGISRYSI